ncbi:MAG: diguanylate cyclase [Anaerolineales bacterium]|nr:diguanylate cyclase [Anaerolineales bacterium]
MGEKQATSLETLARSIFDGLLQIDLNGHIVLWNKGAERITGYTADSITNQDFKIVFAGSSQDSTAKSFDNISMISKTLTDGVEREGLITFKHKEGYFLKLLVRIIVIRNEKGKITGVFEIMNDNKVLISIHQQNKKTDQTVLLDSGTGIGNRAHIELKIRNALEESQLSGIPMGILFIDIDKFKDFNDTYGHLTGDKVLRFVANTLRQNLRTSDSCGRWGGEEFIVLVLDSNLDGLMKIAEKLRRLVESGGINEGEKELHTTISIGATVATGTDTLNSLLERADKLMYQSKEAGRNRTTVG